MALQINLDALLLGYINNTLTDAEKEQLMVFLSDARNTKDFNTAIGKMYEQYSGDPLVYREEEVEKLIRQILHSSSLPATSSAPSENLPRIPFFKRPLFRYAVVLIALIGVGYYLWPVREKIRPKIIRTQSLPVLHDANPGIDKAILTLSDGRKVELHLGETQTIVDGNLAVQNHDGTLIYQKSNIVVYNTMTTPKGAQYRLTLPDGTKVWLNAASSIRFPTSFPGKLREVEITGEAYFEVAKNAGQPFLVKTYKDEIRVIGTHFNINAYPDEAGIKTSLEEGSVRINNIVLKPGEAYINNRVIAADLDHDLAWKNGVFNFNDCDLQAVMRQISRWYDVEVTYQKNIPSMQFYGKMGRDLKLSQVLSILEKSDVHFDIAGTNLIVKP